MCVSQQVRSASGAVTSMSVDAATAQQPWARTAFRQPMKARLPRRLTASARIDLNRHWSALEQLVSCTPPPSDADADAEVALANAVNENLANERLEAEGVALERRFVAVGVDREATPTTPGVGLGKQIASSALMKLIRKLAK